MSSFTSSKPSFDDAEMYVTKRNGKREVVSFDKILQRIKKVGVEVGIKINYTALAMKVIDQLYDSISWSENQSNVITYLISLLTHIYLISNVLI